MDREIANDAAAACPLELSGTQMQHLVDLVMAHLREFLDSLSEQPAWNFDEAAPVARSVMEPMPSAGSDPAVVFRRLFEELLPVGVNSAGPGYLAYVPGGGIPHAAIADLIAATVNRFVGLWNGSPGLAQLEVAVLRWFSDIVGYPTSAGGFFTSGGSLSIWSAIVTARCCKLQGELSRGTLYTSDQAHHSVAKAAMFAGVPPENVRSIAVDSNYRVCIETMRERIQQDRRDGFIPFAIVGHAGTTNTGAVDNLASLADLAEAERLWLHVDAAYGGFFMLTERGRGLMRGIERADSITLDPHKSLFMPYGTGCLLARDQSHLRRAHQLRGEYLMPGPEEEFFDLSDISPELTRSARALRVWLPIMLHGIEPFRSNLEEKLDLTKLAAERLRQINDEIDETLEVITDPQLTVVAFRLVRKGLTDKQIDDFYIQLRDAINASASEGLCATRLHGRYVIRICILSFRTHRDRVETCLEEIRRAVREV
ncbi:MAG TPA: pyridoxal-dependent decarboxylase [Pirellulaceae bacterium]|nr:pyridoxal-dependent decarboxylase [Pirellulaceae bacterium]